MALAFFLFGCREEPDYVNSENSLQNSDSFTKDNVVTKKLFKQDYLSNSFLKQNVEAVNNFLKQKGSSSSAALSKNSTIEGVEVYTDVFEEVDYLNAKYYSFHIAGSSSKEFEQKLVLKYVNNEIKDRYILKYKRLPDLKIDPNSYQLEKLIGSSDGNGNSLLMYIDSFTLGCTTYTVTTFNCGHQGNHSNGEYCSVEKTYIPHDIISAQYNPNCNSEGGGSPSGSTTVDSGSQGSQNTNGDSSPAFLSIYSSAPYYEIEFVPHTNKLLNYLNLTPTEITQINANDNLRLQIYLYLQNLGLYPFTPYLGDEYANASELTKFALQFFAQNPTTTWEQFEYLIYNKTIYETSLGDDDNNTTGGYDTTVYDNFDPLQQNWPTIPSIIPVGNFIGWGYPGIKRNCMDYAKAQIGIKGFQISNYGAPGQTYQIYREQTGVNQSNLIAGLSYLKYALSNNIPVIVGVHDAPGHPGNADQTTDHFIVIVGMGSDNSGKYFTFYDNASGSASLGANPNNKLYYNQATGIISGTSETPYANGLIYILTQIRKSKLK